MSEEKQSGKKDFLNLNEQANKNKGASPPDSKKID